MIFDGGREDWSEEQRSGRRHAIVPAVVLAVLLLVAVAHPLATPVRAWEALAATPIAAYTLPAPWRAAHGQTPPVVLPDPLLTPGSITSADQALVCATGTESYSRVHRKTGEALKHAVRREYHATSCGEVDHRVPLSLGGADVLANLWCEPGPPVPCSYKDKDTLEDVVWRAVCHDRTMTLAEGQAVFLAPDWRVAYHQLVSGASCPH